MLCGSGGGGQRNSERFWFLQFVAKPHSALWSLWGTLRVEWTLNTHTFVGGLSLHDFMVMNVTVVIFFGGIANIAECDSKIFADTESVMMAIEPDLALTVK
jgi:hypothetical protein